MKNKKGMSRIRDRMGESMKIIEHAKDFVEKGVKHLGLVMSFGAYHVYVLNEKSQSDQAKRDSDEARRVEAFKLQDTITQLRIQEMNRLLEEHKKLVILH